MPQKSKEMEQRETITYEELQKLLLDRKDILRKHWEEIFFPTLEYVKQHTKRAWLKRINSEVLALCLAFDSFNLPFTSPILADLLHIHERLVYGSLRTLGTLKLITPIDHGRARIFKLTRAYREKILPIFAKYLNK